MQKVFYGTKEENNQRREAEFLALSGTERFSVFLKMVDSIAVFPTLKKRAMGEEKGNFIVRKPDCGF